MKHHVKGPFTETLKTRKSTWVFALNPLHDLIEGVALSVVPHLAGLPAHSSVAVPQGFTKLALKLNKSWFQYSVPDRLNLSKFIAKRNIFHWSTTINIFTLLTTFIEGRVYLRWIRQRRSSSCLRRHLRSWRRACQLQDRRGGSDRRPSSKIRYFFNYKIGHKIFLNQMII